jgi:hypothetical protein
LKREILVLLAREIHKLFGVVTSFRGTYKTDQWTLQLSSFNGTVDKGRICIILEGVIAKNQAAFQQEISSNS